MKRKGILSSLEEIRRKRRKQFIIEDKQVELPQPEMQIISVGNIASQTSSSSSSSNCDGEFYLDADRFTAPFDNRTNEDGLGIMGFPLDFAAPGGAMASEYERFLLWIKTKRNIDDRSDPFSNRVVTRELFRRFMTEFFPKPPDHHRLRNIQKYAFSKYQSKTGYINASNYAEYEQKWSRFIFSKAPHLDEIYADSCWTRFFFSPVEWEYGYSDRYGLEIRVTGRMKKKGHSATLRLTSFYPYMYFRVPPSWLPAGYYVLPPAGSFSDPLRNPDAPPLSFIQRKLLDRRIEYLVNRLETVLKERLTWWETKTFDGENASAKMISSWQFEEHISAYSYQGGLTAPFVKLTLIHPTFIRKLRVLLQLANGGSLPAYEGKGAGEIYPKLFPEDDAVIPPQLVPSCGFDVFEAHNDFIVRFLSDTDIRPSQLWVVGCDFSREIIPPDQAITRSNVEIVLDYKNIAVVDPKAAEESNNGENPIGEEEVYHVAAHFDIEAKSDIRFPHPDEDPVTMISLRARFGPLNKVSPEDNSKIINEPMMPNETIRPEPCTAAIVFTLGSVNGNGNFASLQFSKEEDLLMAFHEAMIMLQPDMISGHASNIFDFDYLLRRAKKLGLVAFPYFSRYYDSAVTNNAESEKADKKGLCRPVTAMRGTTVWDSLNYAVDFAFAKDRSLDTLCREKVGKGKVEVQYTLIAAMMKDLVGRTGLAVYCNYDVVLTELLDDKQSSLRFIRELADMCSIPTQKVLDRASIFRILGLWTHHTQRYYSKILRMKGLPVVSLPEAKSFLPSISSLPDNLFRKDPDLSLIRFLTPTKHVGGKAYRRGNTGGNDQIQAASVLGDQLLQAAGKGFTMDENEDESYEGGKVLPPIKGMYLFIMFIFLTVLDFTSLYPSIIRRLNLCYTTYIAPGDQEFVCAVFKLDIWKDLWHVPHFMLRDDQMTTTPYIDLKNKPSFIRKHVQQGLTAIIEELVMQGRSATKKKMGSYYEMAKEEKDPVKKAFYLFLAGELNLRQLAEKIICNSIYGYFGTSMSNFPLKDVAETITNIARQALEFTRFHIFRTCRKSNGWNFNALIAYGDTDSVFVVMMDLDTSLVYNYKITRDRMMSEGIEKITKDLEEKIRNGQAKPSELSDKNVKYLATKWVDASIDTELKVENSEDQEKLKTALELQGGSFDNNCNGFITREDFSEFCFHEFKRVQSVCNPIYGDPMNLDVEKTGDGLLNEAKCYALYRREGSNPFGLKFSGLSYVRRGGCFLQRQMCKIVNKFIVQDGKPQLAIDYAREVRRRVRNMELEMYEIVMTSTLSKNPEAYETPSPPPHVKVAMDIKAAGGEALRAGSRVAFAIVGGHKTDKVYQKAKTPLEMLKMRVPYDVDYYDDLIKKECKKLFRSVCDTRSFAEKFLYTETIRKYLGRPDGKDIVKKMKNDLKKTLDNNVEQVIVHNLQISFDKIEKPSLYVLPEIYQKDLAPPQYDWCGYDPEKVPPHISTYIPPYEKKDIITDHLSNQTDNDGDSMDISDDDDEQPCDTIGSEFEIDALYEVDFASESLTSHEKKSQETAFMAHFVRQKHHKKKYGVEDSTEETDGTSTLPIPNKTKRKRKESIKKGSSGKNSAMAKFLVQMNECTSCGILTPLKNMGVCDKCRQTHMTIADIEDLETETKAIQLTKIKDLAETYHTCFKTCAKCIRRDLGYWQPTLIEECIKFTCPENGRRWNAKGKVEKELERGKSMNIEFEIDYHRVHAKDEQEHIELYGKKESRND